MGYKLAVIFIVFAMSLLAFFFSLNSILATELTDIPVKAFDIEVNGLLQDSVDIINASNIWNKQINNINITGKGQSICILDTGIDYNHPDLGGCFGVNCKVIGGWDFVNNDDNPMDDNGHGTHVAGIVAGNGKIKGVANDANLVAVKVLDSSGAGGTDGLTSGINYCIENKEKYNISAISMSLGTTNPYLFSEYCDNVDKHLTKAINNAVANDIAVVAATGNDDGNLIALPACIENATAIGATNNDDIIWRWSNRNSITDLLAPGVNIYSTWLSSGYATTSGTSMAVPHVAGAFALANQFSYLQSGKILNPKEIEASLKKTGKIIEESGIGYSRIDVFSALISLDSVSPYVSGEIKEKSVYCNATDFELKSLGVQVFNSTDLYYEESNEADGSFFEYEFSLIDLPEDNYTFTCSAYDKNNNFEEKSLEFGIGIGNSSDSEINDTSSTDTSYGGFLIELISPENNEDIKSNTIEFNFNVNSRSLENCSLIINEEINQTNFENKTQFSAYLENGNYNWSIICYDKAGNSNSSEIRNLIVNYIAPVVNSGGGGGGGSSSTTDNIVNNQTTNQTNPTTTNNIPVQAFETNTEENINSEGKDVESEKKNIFSIIGNVIKGIDNADGKTYIVMAGLIVISGIVVFIAIRKNTKNKTWKKS